MAFPTDIHAEPQNRATPIEVKELHVIQPENLKETEKQNQGDNQQTSCSWQNVADLSAENYDKMGKSKHKKISEKNPTPRKYA